MQWLSCVNVSTFLLISYFQVYELCLLWTFVSIDIKHKSSSL